MSHTYTVGFSKPHGDQLQQQHRALQPRDANASMLSQPMRFATGIPGFGAPPTAQPFAQHLKPQVNVQHPFVPVGHPALDMPHAQPAHLPNPPMPADATAKTSRHIRKLNGTLPETLKLPPTAVFTDEGEWEETDPHRLAQRKKQLCFGKVTEGYKNYVAMVPKEERQEGNEWHPHTPRLNQVCSKRSWDCQVGRWRRSLHNWDNAPSAEEMRKAPEELRPSREYQPLLVMAAPPATAVKKKLVNLKYTIKGESICHLAVVALQTTYSAFLSKLEPKVGRVASLHYADQEGDVVEVDDDSSLRVYLELVSTATPSPKLCVETLAQSLQLISQALSQEQKYRLAESLAIDLVSVRPATPTQQRKPIPELMDLVTPTPEGETPAMDVYRAVMKTPETEKCAERRRLTFH